MRVIRRKMAAKVQAMLYIIVVASASLVYINSLNGQLVFDDHRAIISNEDLDSNKTTLQDLFQHDFWGGHMNRVESHKSYRPLTVLTYRLFNFQIHQLEPYGYHVVNVCCHVVASLLFLTFCQICIHGSKLWALYGALLFSVHSIHTEAVANVVGRAETLSCIFFLSSILMYIYSIGWTKPYFSPGSKVKWHWLLLSILLAICSLLSKEQGITALGVCISLDILLHWRPVILSCFTQWWKSAESCTSREGISIDVCVCNQNSIAKKTCQLRNILARIVMLSVSGVCIMLWRLSMNYGTQPIFKPEELRATFHEDTAVRIFSFSHIYTINAWLLLSPSGLCCDWSLGSVPLVTEVADSRNLLSLLLYLVLLAFVFCTLRNRKDCCEVGAGFVLCVVPFLPSSGLLFRVGFVVAERVLYMPSLGSCVLVTVGFRKLYNCMRFKCFRILIVAMAVYVLVILSAKTVVRNLDWSTDFRLYESGVKVLPQNVKMRNNYAMELKSIGSREQARKQYEMAMEIDPDYGEVYFNYGNLLSEENNIVEAVKYFEKAAQYKQVYPKTLNNLATMYFKLGHNDIAEKWFLESIRLNPDQANIYSNLGSLYGMTNRPEQAEEMFKQAVTINPTYVEGYFNLGTLLVQHGRPEDGEVYLRKALELNPHHTGAANNLKVALYDKKVKEQQRRKQPSKNNTKQKKIKKKKRK